MARKKKPITDENGEAIGTLIVAAKNPPPEPTAEALPETPAVEVPQVVAEMLKPQPKPCSDCGGMMKPMLWNSRVDIYLCDDIDCPAFRRPQGTATPPSWED